jgi:ABC-type sugar transport system substrate-binding protein
MRRSTRFVPLVSISAFALVTAFGTVGGATTVPDGVETTAPDDTAGASATTGDDAGASTESAPETSGGGSIVAFIPTTTNTYIAEWARGAEERASELGYELTIIENNFDQAEQDTQVQQQLGAADPSLAAYIWWPSDNEAGVASLQALYDSGVPVLQTNQLPFPGSEQFVIGYAGVDDTFNGEVAAGLVVEARDWMVDNGATLHSDGGNAIIVGFVAGYQAGIDRSAAAIPILEDAGIVVLGEVETGFDPQTGYDGTKQLIAAHRDEGIDLVYAHNSALAEGVIQALEEEGYTPGEDVMVVGGTCHGNLEYLEDGREFATGLQAARLEGVFSIDTLDEFLTSGSLAEFGNFIPNPPVHSPVYTEENEIETVTLEGFTVEELCVY